MISYSPQRECITFVKFYTPQRECITCVMFYTPQRECITCVMFYTPQRECITCVKFYTPQRECITCVKFYTPQRECITCVKFYTPQREIGHKTAIATRKTTLAYFLSKISVSLNCGDLRRSRTPLGSQFSNVPYIGIKRNVTELYVITAKLSDLDLLGITVWFGRRRFGKKCGRHRRRPSVWPGSKSGLQHVTSQLIKFFCSPVDADLTKNVDATGESSVCGLAHRDKVRCPSTTELWGTVWKGTTAPTNCSGLVYVVYGNK
ncbi:hypothetical protein AVEN_116193-1 [Araneus ventricosus]|uniref:Uncharacterized protein n=1 Tax=Araneus ventricosus TaxID=182803 RepID=A0A4Y2QLM3_ARAVE|nr:hypothetical protein AVEN_116193-1 [Araneus ventricosus]